MLQENGAKIASGVWVRHQNDESKIAAIGIRVRHWVSLHGISLNVAPELSHFTGIVPCGVTEHGVTSLRDLGLAATMADADEALGDLFHAGLRSDHSILTETVTKPSCSLPLPALGQSATANRPCNLWEHP